MSSQPFPCLTIPRCPCPPRPTYYKIFNRSYPQFVRVSDKAIGMTVYEGQKVALHAGRKGFVGKTITDNKLVSKPQGPTRKILRLRDYRFFNQFDVAAYQVVRGQENFTCTPFPAGRTASHATIPEGTFPLTDFKLLPDH